MKRSLERLFIGIMLVASMMLGYNFYKEYRFEHDFDRKYLLALDRKEREILQNMRERLGYAKRFPVVVTDRIPGRVYGLATFDKQGRVVIFLNKRVFKESFDYILDDVLAHEYAHALLLSRGYTTNRNGGHTPLWRRTCRALGGVHCERYVDREDVVERKLKKLLGG